MHEVTFAQTKINMEFTMNKLILLFAFLAVSVGMQAQSGIISGKILDADDAFSLPGATIKLDYQNRYTVSDQNGDFIFLDVPAGKYNVTIDYIGYQTTTQPVEVKTGENGVVNFSLSSGDIDLDEVVVMGDILRGQAKALNQQRNNNNITNVISADQVGRFPDANIGDALKRVSGVTMQNDQGEARNIIIRGLAPSLNSVSLNGDRIPSAEGDNRNVQMDLIPADMISSIEVNKTLTPDMDADAIGGSVNLVTRVSPNKERVSATISGGYLPIRGHGLYNASFVYGNRYFNDKLGVSLSGSYQNKSYGSDNIEAQWSQGNNNQVYVSQMDIRKYDVQRIRRSASLNLDYEFNINNRITFKSIYNWRDDRENRYRLRIKDIEPVYGTNGDITGFTKAKAEYETKGGVDNSRNKNRRLEDQRVFNFSLDGEHLLSSKLNMDWKVNFSKASEHRPNERYITFRQKDVEGTEDLNDTNYPLIISSNSDLTQTKLKELIEQEQKTHETELGAKINFRFPLSVIVGQKGRIRTGVRLRAKNKERDNIYYEYEPLTSFGNITDVPTSYYGSENWQAGGSRYIPGTFVSNTFLGSLHLTDTSLFTASLLPEEYLAANYKAKENIIAGYVRWDQNFSEKTVMIVGFRIENTAIDYKGNYVEDEEDLVGTIERKNNYTNVLPSLTFKHSVTEDFILRAAITTALARPNYYALAPYVNSIVSDQKIDAGNPDLKATYSYNFDLMAEKYFRSIGMISGGVFYKKMDDFIYQYIDRSYTTDNFATDYPDLANPIPTSENWEYTQKRNGESVDVYGFEVAFQRKLDFLPGTFLSNFSLYGNYTYTKSKAKGITNEDGELRSGLGLPGTAPHMVNGSLAWENRKFSARVSLNYTSDYLDALGGSESDDVYYDKQLFVDVNASYKITPQLRIFLEANNLTNQPLRYYQGSSNYMYQLEYYRPTYTLGLKFDF